MLTGATNKCVHGGQHDLQPVGRGGAAQAANHFEQARFAVLVTRSASSSASNRMNAAVMMRVLALPLRSSRSTTT